MSTATAEATTETTAAVRKYRKSATAERGIRYRLDRGLAGSTRATEYAFAGHAERKADAVETLMAAGLKGMVGMLVEEESLAERLRTAETPRPELEGRLLDLRRKIRRWA
jgi:hypothetical protein